MPIGVADDPMFELEARATKKGWGERLCCFATLSTNSVKIIQEVSLVKKALEMADNKQTLQTKSFAPRLFHDSSLLKYINASALSR